MSLISLVENSFFDNGRYWGALNASLYNSGSIWSMKTGIESADLNWVWNEKPLEASDRKAIQYIKKDFFQSRLPFWWWIYPGTASALTLEMLRAEGFSFVTEVPSLLSDLKRLSDEEANAGAVSLVQVQTRKELHWWEDISFSGFDFSPETREPYHQFVQSFDLSPAAAQKFFLASVDGKPVATSLVFFNGHAAGFYFVTTLSEYRKRGIGLALTRKMMQFAKKAGLSFASLQSSPEGFHMYQQAGFKEICRIAVYSLGA